MCVQLQQCIISLWQGLPEKTQAQQINVFPGKQSVPICSLTTASVTAPGVLIISGAIQGSVPRRVATPAGKNMATQQRSATLLILVSRTSLPGSGFDKAASSASSGVDEAASFRMTSECVQR
jgi:hypothetical protein